MTVGCIWIFKRQDASPSFCVFPQHVCGVAFSGSKDFQVAELQCTHGTYDIGLSVQETVDLVLRAHAGEQVSVITHNRPRFFVTKA